MPLRPACFKRTFSGLRSQWMRRLRNSKSRQRRIECANFLTSGTPKPWSNRVHIKQTLLQYQSTTDNIKQWCSHYAALRPRTHYLCRKTSYTHIRTYTSLYTCVVRQWCNCLLGHVFAKYWPIFKIRSLAHSAKNSEKNITVKYPTTLWLRRYNTL